MNQLDTCEFFKWLSKSKATETDIINCRKMQSLNISEKENAFGLSTIQVSGFVRNDYIKMGGDFIQRYDESKQQYYERVYSILLVCGLLMDRVNGVLVDDGAWSSDYFEGKFNEWKQTKLPD